MNDATMKSAITLAAALATLPLLCGCKQEPPAAQADAAAAAKTASSTDTDFSYQATPQTTLLMEGKQTYQIYCMGCHGINGDGKGEAARYLNPRPRDFTKAQYKFISTRFGELPTDEDLFRTISHGLRGSAMPSWGHLPERKRWALVAYIKGFSDVWQRGRTPAIPVVTDPYADNPDKSEAIARGEMAYHGFFTCWNCHPAYVSTDKINEYLQQMGSPPRTVFRPHLERSAIKSDSNDETIFAPDFHRDYVKSGTTVINLYHVIGAGITGTAMPTWIDSVAPDVAPRDADGNLLVSQADIWAMAYYVQNLIKEREVKFPVGEVVVRDNRKMEFTPEGALYVAKVEDATAGSEATEEFFDEDE
ncbi:MAG: cytochrome c [Phycisphaerales bacterium]|nr:cytochrome c [Phycisphaerales bacterium]